MTSYLAQRLAGTVPVLLLISLLVFLLIHAAPGDPTLMLLGEETNAAEVARAKERWGLDQPLYVQYLKFLKSAASGDFQQHLMRASLAPACGTYQVGRGLRRVVHRAFLPRRGGRVVL